MKNIRRFFVFVVMAVTFVACQPAPSNIQQSQGKIMNVSRVGDLTRTIDVDFGTVCYENYTKTAIFCIKH